MKVILSENKIKDVIYKHLTNNYYPDYNWGEELHDFYKKDVYRHGFVTFTINDDEAFSYLDTPVRDKILVISQWLWDELTNLFGRLFVPVFIEWFENNSGLPVKTIEIL
jgi:hypothetical protein